VTPMSDVEKSDKWLLEAIKSGGDEEVPAFEALYLRYNGQLIKYAESQFAKFRIPELSSARPIDAVQEVWKRVIPYIKKGGIENFESYIFRSVHNWVYDLKDTVKDEYHTESDIPTEMDAQELHLARIKDIDDQKRLAEVFNIPTIAPCHRVIYIMRKGLKYRSKVVGQLLGKTHQNIDVIVHRVDNKIDEYLAGESHAILEEYYGEQNIDYLVPPLSECTYLETISNPIKSELLMYKLICTEAFDSILKEDGSSRADIERHMETGKVELSNFAFMLSLRNQKTGVFDIGTPLMITTKSHENVVKKTLKAKHSDENAINDGFKEWDFELAFHLQVEGNDFEFVKISALTTIPYVTFEDLSIGDHIKSGEVTDVTKHAGFPFNMLPIKILAGYDTSIFDVSNVAFVQGIISLHEA
jgi:DNA-directed RNA polymerase specialized sigma24 family protein